MDSGINPGDDFYQPSRNSDDDLAPTVIGQILPAVDVAPTDTVIDGGGGSEASHPFKVIATDDTKVKVVYGEVGDEVPTQCAVNISDATEISVSADDYVYLDISINATSGDITSVAIGVGASTPSDSTTKSYIRIAKIEFDSGDISAIGQILTHSLGHWSCEARHHFWAI